MGRKLRAGATRLLLGVLMLGGAMTTEARAVEFGVENARPSAATEVARVSVPVPAGLMPGAAPQGVYRAGRRRPAQARVITRHPDGSARRVMLSFPVDLPPGGRADFSYRPGSPTAAGKPLAETDGTTAVVATDAWTLRLRDDAVQVGGRDGTVLAALRAFGPTLTDPRAPTLTVLENGPYVAWLRWRQDGTDYTREFDLQVDKTGRLRLTQRVLRHLAGNGWSPGFGFELSAARATPVRLPTAPVGFLKLPVAEPLGLHPELIATLRLADGTQLSAANPLALRQHRGTLEAGQRDGVTTLRFSRVEPVVQETENLQLQEGMWREVEVVLQPGPPERLAEAVDQPLVAKVDWRAFDAVYHTGPPLRVESPLLERLVEKYIDAIQSLSMKGDDLGSLGGLERYNHCQYIWEDYFRTGDPRLRRVALDYSENYNDVSIYWGPNADFYGGGRYPADGRTQPWPTGFRTRHNDAVSFCTKGYHGFWLAYEETGDPRFRYAAERQAEWSAKHVTAGLNYTRCVGQVIDFVKMHEYTGDPAYLDQAMRLWGDLQAVQNPDLLFTEGGVLATGNELYVPDDAFGYAHPYVKSYITQYATNALPYLLAHRPEDQRLRDTIIAGNDWMARVQTTGGGWSYPGPTTAGFAWNVEYCHGLMAGHEVAPKAQYLDCIQRDLRAIVALFAMYDAIPSGVTPWEYLAGKSAQDLAGMYRLGTDRDRGRDFTDGRLSFGFSPDSTVYLQVLLRDYLKHRPESSLLAGDPVLDNILKMPSALGGHPQSGDPSLRLTVRTAATPAGLSAKFTAEGVYRLADTEFSRRWVLPDGSESRAREATWLFPRRGSFEVKLVARAGPTEYSRTVTIPAPTGPGDLGLAQWPQGIRVQAEGFSAQGGGATGVKARGAGEKLGSEGGSISHWDPLGAWVQWNATVPREGRYYVLARYASPTASRRLVTLDEKEVGALALPPTGGYGGPAADDWRAELLRDEAGEPLAIDIGAGMHVLRLTNNDGMGCNLDYLDLLPEPAEH